MTDPTKGPGSDMPELPDWPNLYGTSGNVMDVNTILVNLGKLRADRLACYAAGVKAGMERAANICNDLMAFDMDDPGSSAAFAIRKESSNG